MKDVSYLSYLTSQLHEKKEQLIRLKNAYSSVNQLQGEFLRHQTSITHPELTSSTWQGTLARKFIEVREDVILSYKDMSQTQMDTAIMSIEDKISSIRSQIQSLEISIANEQERIERELIREEGM
ncbi:DUF5082 domain-containing protein [Bacillus sp. CH30_1T]|nr:DUF5082 domain-containing protein [Bacillus sp. CH30_1T]